MQSKLSRRKAEQMARAGRKRKNGSRTPSGQLSRAGQKEEEKIMRTVLSQPHRIGRLSEWRGTTIGRLLEDDRHHTKGYSRDAFHRAAVRLADLYDRYQRALASRRPIAVTSGITGGPEDVDKSLDAIDQFSKANTVLQRAGPAIRQATLDLCCDHHAEDWQPPFHMAYHAVEGLKLLADHFGLDWQGEDRRAA